MRILVERRAFGKILIGYVSGSAKNGGYRSVRVVAKAAGKELVVRTRTGYIAQEASR